MKALKLIIPLLCAISVLGMSQVGSGGPDFNNTNSSVYSTLAGQLQVGSSSFAQDQPYRYSQDNQLELLTPNDPFFSEQWALITIQASSLWQITKGSQEVLVAILDTGIDQNHEDLIGQIVAAVNFTDSPTTNDIYGHGTHVAGIIAAEHNSVGVAGLAPGCKLLNVKVADDRGRCQVSDLARGIIWAVDNGADVINISIQIKESSPELEQAINYAWDNGAVIIAAAGNNGSQSPIYPAYYNNCLAVAAVKQDDSLAPLSNHGDWVNVAAPGFQIYSTLPDNSYGFESGTSFATAYVSGMAALLFSVVTDTNGNGMLNDEVCSAIETGCQEIDISGVGSGRIDIAKVAAQTNNAFLQDEGMS